MTVQDVLDMAVVLMNSFLAILTTSAAIYWVYAERRIHHLEAKLWLRRIGMEE